MKAFASTLAALRGRLSGHGTAGARAPARARRDRALRLAALAVLAAFALMALALRVDESAAPPALEARKRPAAADPPAFALAAPARMAEAPPAAESAPAGPAGTAAAAEAVEAVEAEAAEAELGAQPALAAAPPVAPVALADGYRVQLGVFGDPANAAALQAELAGRGLPAHVQSRVVLGPYARRAEAERAQAQLRRAGAESGVLVAPQRPRR